MPKLTFAAARQIHAAADSAQAESTGAAVPALRLAAAIGADGSPVYGMGFDEIREGDLAVLEKGVQLLIGRPSQALLQDIEVDFVEYLPGEFRFIFVAPQAAQAAAAPGDGCTQGSCGCAGNA